MGFSGLSVDRGLCGMQSRDGARPGSSARPSASPTSLRGWSRGEALPAGDGVRVSALWPSTEACALPAPGASERAAGELQYGMGREGNRQQPWDLSRGCLNKCFHS